MDLKCSVKDSVRYTQNTPVTANCYQVPSFLSIWTPGKLIAFRTHWYRWAKLPVQSSCAKGAHNILLISKARGWPDERVVFLEGKFDTSMPLPYLQLEFKILEGRDFCQFCLLLYSKWLFSCYKDPCNQTMCLFANHCISSTQQYVVPNSWLNK